MYLLFPFSLIYNLITSIRNLLFDFGLLKSYRFGVPTIVVGNLSMGGTGKTPHTEMIISYLLQSKKVAFLSRGYKRHTKGFVLAADNSTALTIGDEPFQIYRKFSKKGLIVAVDEDRVRGVRSLIEIAKPDVIVLDDAFQHRRLRPRFSVLLTEYNKPYYRDYVVPMGRLRESSVNSKRANVIIITKSPKGLNEKIISRIRRNIKPQANQLLLFSYYKYKECYPLYDNQATLFSSLANTKKTILLISGIVSPKLIVDYLSNDTTKVESLNYPDHYNFTENDFNDIENRFNSIEGEKVIVTTEKDAARMISSDLVPESIKPYLYVLPIEVKFYEDQQKMLFDKIKEVARV